MNGKEFFRECCRELNLDCDELFVLGEGNPKNPSRFIYKSDPYHRKESQLYAIKYFTSEKVYVAWSLKEPKAKLKSVFSLSKDKGLGFNEKLILTPEKHIEYSGWNEETVYVFPMGAVKEFLNSFIIPIVK